MQTKIYFIFFVGTVLIGACTSDTQIGENTFVHNEKIYRVIDNEVREIGDLSSKEIKQFEVSRPKEKDFGTSSLSFVKPGAYTSLKALYRGNFLYYTLMINGLNDLRENYNGGTITVEFVDEYGFIMHATEIPTSELIGEMGEEGKYSDFIYHGKTEMSTEINAAIKKYDVTASIKHKSYYGY
ncbi:hypothetical protein ACFQZI_10400 [Mucilaginibacter lutimaris]|uniref:Lipoprotein n=1 Tax=Mucilaginibacter lutimaris TaxID=931629 RepID=A0ABW2ZGH5_9SPHI